MFIVWNEARTIGIVVNVGEDSKQLAYELRKGSLNGLGHVPFSFVDSWGDMTVHDNCTIEEVKGTDNV